MEMLYSNAVNPNKTNDGIPIGNLIFDWGIMEFLNNKEQTLDENQFDYLKYASDRYRNLLERISKEVLNKRVHPHQFRHFVAQSLLNKGLGIVHLKLFLGHQNLSSTEIYAKSSAELLKKELEKLDNGS
jgi:site-specific recombinase XerD